MTTPPGIIPLTQPVPQPLRRFGQYYLVQKLAEGGMAEIFLAKQVGAEGFERDVVVKLMLEHFTNSRDFVDMFLDEARLAARLHHPNVVQISDLGVADGRYFLCMEYLAGEDLQTVIERGAQRGEQVPLGVAARIILMALEGLEYAHDYTEGGARTHLVHRDVSPSNIFVTFQGNVKVLDFGIAKASSKLIHTQPGTVKGKLGYMSPEQARGEALDARSDLFSLGVSFHELLTGRRVFQKDSEVGVLLAMMGEDVPPPSSVRPEIPGALDAIVRRATQRDVNQRYASAGQMREEVEAFLASHVSVGGTSHVATWMQRLFGPDAVRRRTQIPTLKELSAQGFVLPPDPAVAEVDGFEKTFVRPATGPADPKQQLTDVLGARPITAKTSSPSRTGWGVALTLVALLAVGAAAAMVAGVPQSLFAQRNTLPPPPPLEEVGPDPVAVEPPPVETAPVAAADPVVPPPPIAEEPVGVTRPPRRVVTLTPASINAVLARKQKALVECATTHQADLPAGGVVEMVLVIEPSGKVSDASATQPALGKTRLARCMSRQLEKVTFPRNDNGGLRFNLPMRFAQ
ncbi:MAG: protein kinase [Myxococcota bacterium]|nr:protein kinase [Myxococcota bacterium]